MRPAVSPLRLQELKERLWAAAEIRYYRHFLRGQHTHNYDGRLSGTHNVYGRIAGALNLPIATSLSQGCS